MTRRGLILIFAAVVLGFRSLGWFTVGGQVSRNGWKYSWRALEQMVSQMPGRMVGIEPSGTPEVLPLSSTLGIVTHARLRFGMVQVKVRWFVRPPSGAFLTPSGLGTVINRHIEDYQLSHLAVSESSALLGAATL